ncbi:PAS domain-containing protein [Flammeovirga pacifica]|uniref:PAS domain-containing protein n=1 Tax=Flammeovirga pacifica TaxID=915059 RepID=A0A1S1YWZ9_FLAPC|nr:PAS domain-containing protein [Flammeovirga pacifica]OHX65550.1 hypothetical protein NH26_03900 [Flammeovirga pacifica]
MGSSNKRWIYQPIDILIKHLEYESQGIDSELSRDVPAEWQNIFLEIEIGKEGKNSKLNKKEIETEVDQHFHAQLEELRWAKSQLGKYQSQGKLIEEKSTISKIFDNANIGILLTNENGIPTYVNSKAKELLGKEIKPQSEEDFLTSVKSLLKVQMLKYHRIYTLWYWPKKQDYLKLLRHWRYKP